MPLELNLYEMSFSNAIWIILAWENHGQMPFKLSLYQIIWFKCHSNSTDLRKSWSFKQFYSLSVNNNYNIHTKKSTSKTWNMTMFICDNKVILNTQKKVIYTAIIKYPAKTLPIYINHLSYLTVSLKSSSPKSGVPLTGTFRISQSYFFPVSGYDIRIILQGSIKFSQFNYTLYNERLWKRIIVGIMFLDNNCYVIKCLLLQSCSAVQPSVTRLWDTGNFGVICLYRKETKEKIMIKLCLYYIILGIWRTRNLIGLVLPNWLNY